MNRITYPAAAPETLRKADWRDNALCRKDENPEDWFPVGGGHLAKAAERHATAVCGRCPSRNPCLRWALETDQTHGIWGGTTEAERLHLRRAVARHPIDTATAPTELVVLFAANTRLLRSGHLLWTGAKTIRHDGRMYTPNRVGFRLVRGQWPVGRVERTCPVAGCVWHLSDGVERGEQTAETTVAV